MIDEENRMVGGTGDGLLPKIYKAHDKNGHQDAHQGQERAQLRTLQHRLVPGQEHSVPEGVAAVTYSTASVSS